MRSNIHSSPSRIARRDSGSSTMCRNSAARLIDLDGHAKFVPQPPQHAQSRKAGANHHRVKVRGYFCLSRHLISHWHYFSLVGNWQL